MKTPTKFRKRRTKITIPSEEIQALALDWSAGKITYKEFIEKVGVKFGYVYLALALRDHINSRRTH